MSPRDTVSPTGNILADNLRSPIEMHESLSSYTSSTHSLEAPPPPSPNRTQTGGLAKHTLGLILLLCVVFLWTLSNFLGSTILSDNTYAKPFFVTYVNTSVFTLLLIPILIKRAYRRYVFRRHVKSGTLSSSPLSHDPGTKHFGVRATARLALSFCILWFLANIFAMACLEHTTVASATILTSTSSIWTLLIGALAKVEKFTIRKLLGVLASLCGIILISRSDLSNPDESLTPPSASSKRTDSSSTFPNKSPAELILGDGMAFVSAILYGFYTIVLRLKTEPHPKSHASSDPPLKIHLPLFFSLVGLLNTVILLPLFPLLHYTGLEPFALPPTPRIWKIILVNSASSLTSDVMWAYAMVLTSPLVVTVGLSLTIPLSLVGEMFLQGRVEGWIYWIGAAIVAGGFVVVEGEGEREEKEGSLEEEDEGKEDDGEAGSGLGRRRRRKRRTTAEVGGSGEESQGLLRANEQGEGEGEGEGGDGADANEDSGGRRQMDPER